MKVHPELRRARPHPAAAILTHPFLAFSANSASSPLSFHVSPLFVATSKISTKSTIEDPLNPLFSISAFHFSSLFRTLVKISAVFAHTSQKRVGVHPPPSSENGSGPNLEPPSFLGFSSVAQPLLAVRRRRPRHRPTQITTVEQQERKKNRS